MKSLFVSLIFCAALAVNRASAADPSIDRLLNKLPSPEKFVDPAQNDPLAKYPKSLGAQVVHGLIALGVRQFAEASAAYRKALAIRSGFPAAYLGIALAEASQGHFRVALSNFQQITRIAPKADIGWIGSSACAEKLGMRQESLNYARRATALAPSSPGAWYQLAREEGLFGDKQAAAKALAHANQLQGKTRTTNRSRGR